MSEQIQPLLDRIHSEGLKKAEAERADILDNARAEADALRENARREADTLREEAEADARASRERGQVALEQAARDLLLRLRTELARQVKAAATAAAAAPLSSAELAPRLLADLVKARGETGSVSIETTPEMADTLKQTLPALLRDAGSAAEAHVVMNPKTGAGFQLRFGDTAEGIDFTDKAVAEWLSAGLRKDLADLLAPEARED